MQTPLHKQNKRMVRHPPSPYLAYVILERKCRPIVPRTWDCSAGKSIKSPLPLSLVTKLTSVNRTIFHAISDESFLTF